MKCKKLQYWQENSITARNLILGFRDELGIGGKKFEQRADFLPHCFEQFEGRCLFR